MLDVHSDVLIGQGDACGFSYSSEPRCCLCRALLRQYEQRPPPLAPLAAALRSLSTLCDDLEAPGSTSRCAAIPRKTHSAQALQRGQDWTSCMLSCRAACTFPLLSSILAVKLALYLVVVHKCSCTNTGLSRGCLSVQAGGGAMV